MELLLAPLGLFAGLLVWQRIVYLLYALLGLPTKQQLQAIGATPAPDLIQTVLRVFAVLTTIWLPTFAFLAYHFVIGDKNQIGWAWFFGGAAATPGLVAFTLYSAYRRMRKRTNAASK